MSVHPFVNRKPQVGPTESYFTVESVARSVPRLRTLTALEQMYAYWGADRA